MKGVSTAALMMTMAYAMRVMCGHSCARGVAIREGEGLGARQGWQAGGGGRRAAALATLAASRATHLGEEVPVQAQRRVHQ